MPKMSEQTINNVITLYNTKYKNLAKIAKELSMSRPTVRKILRQNGLRCVYKKDIDNSDTININFFDTIDTQEKAYFLGLMYADGNNYIGHQKRKHYSISLCLQERDKKIIEKFKKLMAPNHKLYLVKKPAPQQDQYKLLFESKIVSDQLIKLGCVPAKSLKLEYPKNIFNSMGLERHFIRGYFDGDGCLSSYKLKNGYQSYSVSLASTRGFCLGLKKFVEKELGVHSTIYIRKSNNITTEMIISGNRQVYKFMKWLYNGSGIHIERKYNKFLELQKQKRL